MGINTEIEIIEQMEDELKVLIQCRKADDEVLRLKTHIELFDNKLYARKDFIRISKSLIVNINKIRSLRPELNRTILATMCNGECLAISRKYVPAIRKLLSI